MGLLQTSPEQAEVIREVNKMRPFYWLFSCLVIIILGSCVPYSGGYYGEYDSDDYYTYPYYYYPYYSYPQGYYYYPSRVPRFHGHFDGGGGHHRGGDGGHGHHH